MASGLLICAASSRSCTASAICPGVPRCPSFPPPYEGPWTDNRGRNDNIYWPVAPRRPEGLRDGRGCCRSNARREKRALSTNSAPRRQ